MYVAVLASIGWVPLAVTTNLSINFLKKPGPRALDAECRLLKLGKRLAVGEISIRSEGEDELAAHATHQAVDRAVVHDPIAAPHLLHQRLAAEHPAGPRGEEVEQVELERGERHGLATALHHAPGRVHVEGADLEQAEHRQGERGCGRAGGHRAGS